MFKLRRFLKDYIPQLIIGPICKFLEAVFELLVPLVMANLIDNGILNNDKDYVLKMGGVIVLLGVVGLSSALVCQYMASYTSQGMGTKIRTALLKHINTLSHKELDKLGTPTLITRMTNDINTVQLNVAMIIRLLIRTPFLVIGALIMACLIDIKISIVFFVASLLIAVVLYLVMSQSLPFYKKIQKILDRIALLSRENLTGSRVIRAFSKEQDQNNEFADTSSYLEKTTIRVGKLSALLNPATYVITYSAIIFILYLGGQQVNKGFLLSGDIIALTSYMMQILLQMIVLSNLVVILSKGSASAERINKLFETTSTVTETNTEYIEKNLAAPKLEFKNVSFSYGGGDNELENLSFKINRNTITGIIGTTGSGKSTLTSLILHYYNATEGEVFIDGYNVKDYPFKQLRKEIGVVPQKSVLFSGTIRSNLLWQDENATDEQLWKALEIAQAKEFVEKLPNKLDTTVAQEGTNFSGGQRQRLCIARALVSNPEMIILDDSFSALDYATDKALREKLFESKKDTTFIIVTQRCATIMNADKILVLEDGNLLSEGTHQELLEKCPTYKEICLSQLQKEEVGL